MGGVLFRYKLLTTRAAAAATLTIFFLFPVYLMSRSSGSNIELGKTGGPFPGEQTCGISRCHNTTPNSSSGSVSMTVDGQPVSQYEYMPGEAVEIIVRIADPIQQRWGFQLAARQQSDTCVDAGTISAGDGSMIRTAGSIGSCSGGLDYAMHTIAKTGANEATYSVNWTAPAQNVGPVIFAVAGNAANGNGTNTGDHIYTSAVTVESVLGAPNAAPSVSINSPANGATFTEGESIAFSGSATDVEDGNISSELTWKSNLAGSFGAGASVNTTALGVGFHTITAEVTDSGGLKDSDSISITVEAALPPPPEISSGGAVLATLLPTLQTGSANAILTVFGQNFAPEGTLIVNPELDGENRITTNLADVCVEVNSERSPIFAVTPTQVNFQASHALAGLSGPLNVVVIRDCGTPDQQSSGGEPITFAATSPGFFVFLEFGGENSQNPIATLHQNFDPVAPEGLFLGASPAVPGEIVSLFATGLGPTSPITFEAGQVPILVNPGDPTARITSDFTITVGGVEPPPEDIFYVGVAPCCAGLYQIAIRTPPELGTGNHEVIMTVDGVSSGAGPFLPVQAP